MKILSIDTASSICGVCILDDTTILKQIDLSTEKSHSQNLMPIIENIFNDCNLTLSNIDLIVCDIGPGSFTGIRIGVSTAKAFCDSLDIKNIGVSSLETLAYNIRKEGYICSLIDCKNSNCYYALYELKNNSYINIEEPKADNINNILSSLFKYNNITFVGNGAINYHDIIKNTLQNCSFADDKENSLNSYSLGLAGRNKYLNNEFKEILPMYLRKPQAELQLEQKDNS